MKVTPFEVSLGIQVIQATYLKMGSNERSKNKL